MAEFRRSSLVPHVEARRSCQENPCYRPHSHDSFSIGLIDAGTSVLTGPLDGTIRLEPGDVVVIPAGQVHACNPDAGRWLYQMIHIDQDWVISLAPETGRLLNGISVVRHADLSQRIGDLNDAVFADASRDQIESGFAALFRLLDGASPTHLVTTDASPGLLARLRPVMDRLRYDETSPALDELADLVGMSSHQFVRAMKRATGLAPLAWRQNARIVQARHLLREGTPIAETAHELGFFDQSHFHRVFRAHVAASPGIYRS